MVRAFRRRKQRTHQNVFISSIMQNNIVERPQYKTETCTAMTYNSLENVFYTKLIFLSSII